MENGGAQPPQAGRWVSMREAAVYLGIWEGTIRKRVEAGLIEGKKLAGPNGLEWRIWLPSVPTEPPTSSPEAPLEPPASAPEGVSLEVYQDLLARHEQALMRLGGYQAEAARVPMLMEDAAASAARSAALEERLREGERERLQVEARAKDAAREAGRAAALHAQERRRGQLWAAGALVLAVLAAVLGAILAMRAG